MRHLRLDHGVQLTATRQATARACGKTILVGEHFVLHGLKAVALPVLSRHVEVSLATAPNADSDDHAPVLDYAGPPEGARLVAAMCDALGLAASARAQGHSLSVRVAGDLPLAAGLGSSAALAVALVRAADALADVSPSDPLRVRERAHQLEQLAHGRASGIDDAVIAWQRALVFDPQAVPGAAGEDHRFAWLQTAEMGRGAGLPPFWLAWTRRERSTRDAVAAVAALREAEPERFAAALAGARAAVDEALAALGSGAWTRLGAACDACHDALQAIGVVTTSHAAIVSAAREAGAWGAKTTGAGCGGAVLILGPATLDLAAVCALPGVEGCFFAGGDA